MRRVWWGLTQSQIVHYTDLTCLVIDDRYALVVLWSGADDPTIILAGIPSPTIGWRSEG